MARLGVAWLARGDRLVEARGFAEASLAVQGEGVLEGWLSDVHR